MSSSSPIPGLRRDRLHALVGGAGPVPEIRSFKVRDVVDLGDRLLVVTSDRVSAFDRIVATIPDKGQVLNQLSAFWFRHTADIVANHLLREVTPRSMLVRRCSVVPVEVVVRGYLTGSAWRDYQRDGAVSGIRLPAGMRAEQRFAEPLLTPSTKAPPGGHDRPLARDELLAGDIVDGRLWERIEAAALQLYRRGVELAARRGLILVDTKYEFGTIGEELVLADEVHTPDSSRYWYAGEYAERFAEGRPQRTLDKEFLRAWLMERGYMGDGEAPEIPDHVRDRLGERYREAFRLLTGTELVPSALGEQDELAAYADLIRAVSAGE